MEAVVVIGLICNIVQLLDYGRKLARELREVHDNANASTGSDQGAAEARLRALIHIVKKMEANPTPHSNSATNGGNGHLELLCNMAQTRAGELADMLAAMRPPCSASTARQVKLAMRNVGQQAKIKALSKELGELYAEAQSFYQMCISQENATQLAQQSSRMVDIMSIAETTRRDVQALVKQLNELPRGCGQEWEHDPVVYVDDGLTAPFSVPIRFCHSKTGLIAALSSMFAARRLPGRHQYESEHVDILDTAFNTVNDNNWVVSVRPGRKFMLSFVMGTLHGFPRSKCPRCRKPYRSGARPAGEWNQCSSCKLETRLALPDDYAYEPKDVVFGFNSDAYRDYQLGKQKQYNYKSPKAVSLYPFESDTSTIQTHVASPHHGRHNTKDKEEPTVELVCRRVTIKWEPCFNIAHRYLMCRCVLRLSTPSRSRFDPENAVYIAAPCPRHNNRGISYRDYGELVDNHKDSHFESFGGYDCFRAMLASKPQVYKELGGEAFMTTEDRRHGMDKLESMLETSYEKLKSAWATYNDELLDHLRPRPPESFEYFPSNHQQRIAESPMMQEVARILEGKWDGRPHWSWDTLD